MGGKGRLLWNIKCGSAKYFQGFKKTLRRKNLDGILIQKIITCQMKGQGG